jgi:allantoicase
MQDTPQLPLFATRYTNLAQARLGAKALACSDDFFADKQRMLQNEPAVFIPGKYDEHGKWMDGWESRRKRVAGHDWCTVKLGVPGRIRGVDVDTSHFTGNYPPAASLEATVSAGDPDERTVWTEILPAITLKGSSRNFAPVDNMGVWTHVRLNIFPDGGVARLRVYGEAHNDWASKDKSAVYDLVALENGGRAIGWNDAHYNMPEQLLLPGRGINMGDGWETRRRREPGNDWCVLALGHAGIVEKIEVDTAFYKGNYPDRCSVQAAHITSGTDQSTVTQSMFWQTLLPEQKLQPDAQLYFAKEIVSLGAITHVRFNIFPDGGVSRLRLFGRLA